MRRVFLPLMTATLLAVSVPALAQETPGDPVVLFAADDPEMALARDQARRTLPLFLNRLDGTDRDPSDMLKVGLPTPGESTEHIWVDDVRRDGDGFTGALANNPVELNMRRGERVAFTKAQISDWGYWSGDRLWGNYTTRVMLARMPKERADALSAILSPTPIEDSQR